MKLQISLNLVFDLLMRKMSLNFKSRVLRIRNMIYFCTIFKTYLATLGDNC